MTGREDLCEKIQERRVDPSGFPGIWMNHPLTATSCYIYMTAD